MEDEDRQTNRPWDIAREFPNIEDEHTPWKLLKLLKFISLSIVAIFVFGLALCSKTSFLLLITLANEGTLILSEEQKPVALLCIGCALITSSVLLFLKSIWKACYKTSKLPRKDTMAVILFFEIIVSAGSAVLVIVAMPHFDIVTNVTIFNGVGILSALLQVIAQCSAKERNQFLLPSLCAFIFLLLGFILFGVLYIMKDPTNTQMIIWVGLAIGSSLLVSFNWWENYFRLIAKTSRNQLLKNICEDMKNCQNILHIISSLLRIAVTASVLGAYVPLSQMDWDIVRSIPGRETRIIAIIIGVQLVSSALCHWFSLAACKMHALRRCFIVPLYLASLAVMVLLIVPVIVYYEDYKLGLNGTASANFTGYCATVVDGRNRTLTGNMFPELVLDVTHTLCYLDMSAMIDIGLLTGTAVSWWLGFVLVTIHIFYLSVYRIQRTQDLFIRRLYEGAFVEQSLLLNTRFDIQNKEQTKKWRPVEMLNIYLCATMWHETYDEMMNIVISVFRLDRYRPKNNPKVNDFTFEVHIYFDDAFQDVDGGRERHLNEYGKMLVQSITEVYNIFLSTEDKLFRERHHIPDQKVIRTPYGGRLIVTMPEGNNIVIHFKDKTLIRHKKRWSQIMYLYYLLGWKLMSKYYNRWKDGDIEKELKAEVEKEINNTYILALDGDTDFQPSSVMMLIDRLRMYPKVGAACARIHPTGAGPAVWFQKFEYAVSHWLQKTAEHVFGSVLCSPGCFSLFRAKALMDNNVMKTYASRSIQASHYIQHDQGEDRWLCTLLLQQGWRVEYNAASDAYTNAPEDFKELYNQRRRWGPSTLANISDLLGSTTTTSKKNTSVSKLYLFYQMFIMCTIVLSPATICLMIASGLAFVLRIHSAAALVIAIIPPAIYLGLCYKIKEKIQLTIAALLSVMYAFLMLVVIISIIGSMIIEETILTPSSMFIIVMACIYIITAIMHPQEFTLIFYSFVYILCVPSAYLVLIIYSMVNLDNISWGTRETSVIKQEAKVKLTGAEKARRSFQRFASWFKCCGKSGQQTQSRPLRSGQHSVPEPEDPELQPQNTIVEDNVSDPDAQQSPVFDHPVQCWVTKIQESSTEMRLLEDSVDQEEEQFWRDFMEKYLKPLPNDKEYQAKIKQELRELKNKVTFVFFILNAMWLVAAFTLQLFEEVLSISIPIYTVFLEPTGKFFTMDPIAFMFIVGFAITVIIQFLAMLYHRIGTLIHYVAYLDTEPKEQQLQEKQNSYQAGRQVSSETSVSSTDSWSEFEESDEELNVTDVTGDASSSI
ncbi:chitin synthase chs-2-like [Gouania willdenowi]|uniref:chitin synthase chs-2-like n=1 Tax=Gouania willdenowi TaxID=441366 RepID=UPI0010541B3B|nr:chitin synthase chs-2-like [Gouania willdenowi]